MTFVPNGMPGRGGYGILKHIPEDFQGFTPVTGNSDHTYPGNTTKGYFMFIDPSDHSVGQTVAETTISNLCKNTELSFSFWASDMWSTSNAQTFANAHNGTQPSTPKFDVELVSASGEVLVQTNICIPARTANQTWHQYGLKYTIPDGLSSVKFRLVNREDNGMGNDYGIDDIKVVFCGGTITQTVTDFVACTNESVTMTNTVNVSGITNKAYKWQFTTTPNNESSWTTISGATQQSYSIPSVTAANDGYYRMFVADASLIANVPGSGQCALKTPTDYHITVNPTFTSGVIQSGDITRNVGESIPSIGNQTYASGGSGTITYKWQRNGVDIPGTTGTSTYSYTPPAETTPGVYTFKRYAKDELCSGWSLSGGTYKVTVVEHTCTVNFNANMEQQDDLQAACPTTYTATVGQAYGSHVNEYDHTLFDNVQGYTFGGWNTAADGSGTAVNASTIVTLETNHTLYAQWIPVQMTVSFNTHGGTGTGVPTTPLTINYGQQYGDVTGSWDWIVAKTGYRFLGWSLAADGSDLFVGPGSHCSQLQDHTLHAIWREDTQLEDVAVCSDDPSITLHGEDGYMSYSWTPTTGLDNPNSQNPTLDISALTPGQSYTYTCTYGGYNNVFNYDFTLENKGFYSDYVYKDTAAERKLKDERTYSVMWDAHNGHNTENGLEHGFHQVFSHGGDQAEGGRLMVCNGGNNPDHIVWEQTIKVTPNKTYTASAWAVYLWETVDAALLQFFINGTPIGSQAVIDTYQWEQISGTWNSGSNEYATIQIRNASVAEVGNDFGLDDIYFVPDVNESDDMTVTVLPVFTAGELTTTTSNYTRGETFPTTTISPTAASGGDGNISYQWYVNDTPISGASEATYTIPTDPYTNVPGTYVFTRKAKDGKCNMDEVQTPGSYTLVVENNLDMDIDCATAGTGNCYTFPNLTVSGYIRTITVGFTEDPVDGMSVTLPTLPAGWDADGNEYTQFISLPEEVSEADVQAFLRQVTFCVPDNTLKGIRILIDAEQTDGRIYYNSKNRHYYELVKFDRVQEFLNEEITEAEMKAQSADLNTTWMMAYNRAKATTYLGRKGYLTTLTSYDEDKFVTRLTEGVAFIGGTRLSHTGDDGDLHYLGFDPDDQTNPDADDYWYWACGPEKGKKLFNGIMTQIPDGMSKREYYESQLDDEGNVIYSNWGGSEPNNAGSQESILTILLNHNYTGYQGHTDYFAWNDKNYNSNYVYETGVWGSQGFLIEFGDLPIGDSHEEHEDDYRTSSVVRYEEVGNGYDTVRATISGDASYCEGATTTTQLQVTFDGEAPFTGKVTGSDGTEYTFTDVDATTYTFNVTPTATTTYTVTEISDNAATDCHPVVKKEMLGTATVTINPNLTAPTSLTYNTNICNTSDGVTVTVTATDGEGTDADIHWSETSCADITASSPSGATYTLTAPAAGTTVTVYADRVGECHTGECKSVEITVPAQLTIAQSGDITPAKCKGDENGEFKFTVSGGTAPYTVSVKKGTDDVTYTNDGNTYTVSDLAAGTYTVSVTDAHHCTATGTTSYVVTEPEAELEMSFSTHADSSRSESCDPANDGIATVNAKGGNGGYHYTWAVKNVDNTWTTLSQTGKMVTGLQGTREGYTGVYKVTVTDAKGCEVSDGTVVTLNNTLAMPETIQGPTICSGNSFVVQPADSSANGVSQYSVPAGTTYSWGKPVHDVCVGGEGITPKSGMNAITGVLTSECPGLSYVTYTVEPQYGVCKGTSSDVTFGVEVNVNPGIVVTMPESYHKCSNDPNFNIQASFSNSLPPFTTKWTRRTNNDASTDEVVATHHHNVGDTCMLTVDLDNDVCKGVFAYKVEYVSDNAVGCKAEGLCVVTVDAGTWSIPANGEKNVECVSAATEDNIDFPATAPQDACGRDLTRTFVGKELQPTEFSCNGKIVYTYRYTACDNSYKDWTYTFNIEDKTKPVVNVTGFSGEIAADIDQTKCEFTVPDLTATVRAMSSDNCIATNNLTISQNVDAGTKITAATQVRVHVIDSCGNDSTIVITVTVPTKPQAAIVADNVTDVQCHGQSTGSAEVTVTGGTAPYTYAWSDGQDGAKAENLAAGNYSVTVTDANGCQTASPATVTIKEPDALSISGCLSNITKNTDEGKCYATVTWTNPTFAPTGNNAHLEVTYEPALAVDGQFPKGTTTVTITAVNDCGESVSCNSFNVTVTDDENPEITCGVTEDQVVLPDVTATDNSYTHSGAGWDATATDNCYGTTVTYALQHEDPTVVIPANTNNTSLDGQVFPYGTTTVTWTATEVVSEGTPHTSTCTFTVTVEDKTKPEIACNAVSDPEIKYNDPAQAYHTHLESDEVWNPTATDNSGVVTSLTYSLSGATVLADAPENTSLDGQQFNIGTTTVTWVAKDAVGNESEPCSYTVTVEDDEDPCIDHCDPIVNPGPTCATIGAQSKTTDDHVSYYTHSGTDWDVKGKDNSGIDPVMTWSLENPDGTTTDGGESSTLAGQKFYIGTTTVTWTATDGANRTATCSFTVTVEDDEDPCIGCDPDDDDPTDPTKGVDCDDITLALANQTIYTDFHQAYYTHSGAAWDVTATDNSGVVYLTWKVTNSLDNTEATGSSTLDGVQFNLGVNTVEWTATDPSGNHAECTFNVTVKAKAEEVNMVCPTGNSITKTYDGTPLNPVATATSLIRPEDVFTIEYNTTDPADETAWSTTVPSITNAYDGPLHVYVRALNPNYETATCEYTLTINKRQLTITGNFSKVYDGTPFVVNYNELTYDGLLDGDAFTSGTVTTEGYKVGEYHCTENQFLRYMDELFAHNSGFGPDEVRDNYTPVFNVVLRITRRPVELTANSLGKVYDGTSLEAEGFSVTGSYTEDEYGFLGKDDVVSAEVQGEQLCVGESASSVVPESVQIMHEGEVVTDCYEFTFVDGTLTVTNVTTGLECAGTKTFTLAEGTSELVVTEAMIGEATYTGTAADVTITNNLDDLNPMTVRDEPYEVVWTLRDVCGNAMTSCTTLVTTQYTPCEGTYAMTDGSYPYKRIGSQCWFLLNLREKVGDYHPYKDINDNTDKFGYLYSWYTAAGVTEGDNTAVPMTYEGSNGESYVQGICPAGWSIGSDEDYEILNNYATHVMYLKSPSTLYWQSGFEGVNTPDNTGFDGRGGGWYNSSAGHYEDLMTGYHFWTSDATAFSSNATGEVINYYCDSITEETGQKADRRSVRCIRKVYND